MDARFRPISIQAPHGARTLDIQWADGQRMTYPHEILRGFCPCAGCQGHTVTIRYQTGGDLELTDIERVGNYAMGFTWGDRHSSGIYSFRYLRTLGELLEVNGPEGLKALGELPRS